MRLAVVIPTYRRSDGQSAALLTRALDCVFSQSHRDFRCYVIGDRYDDDAEFRRIVGRYDPSRLYAENRAVAPERDKYTDRQILWATAGQSANDYGIQKAIGDGFRYVAHLDHDDFWYPNHLAEISRCADETGAAFICTRSAYLGGQLPNYHRTGYYTDWLPAWCQVVHSSTCIDFWRVGIRYRNVWEDCGTCEQPGDADMWRRLREYLPRKGLRSIVIDAWTCRHDDEGHVKREGP